MCEHYEIDVHTYKNRINRGWTVEKALTYQVEKQRKVWIDPKGREFNSARELCKEWNISEDIFLYRMNRGFSPIISVVIPNVKNIGLDVLVGVDGYKWYKIPDIGDGLYSERQVVEFYRPDLIEAYDKFSGKER